MQAVHGVWEGVDMTFLMFWATLWALVLGFALLALEQSLRARGHSTTSGELAILPADTTQGSR